MIQRYDLDSSGRLKDSLDGDFIMFSDLPTEPKWVDRPDSHGFWWTVYKGVAVTVVEIDGFGDEYGADVTCLAEECSSSVSSMCGPYRKWMKLPDVTLPVFDN